MLNVRVQDIRRALTYVSLLASIEANSPVEVLCRGAESSFGALVRVGWYQQGDVWKPFEANSRFSQTLLAGLHVAACSLLLGGVVSFRFASGVETLLGISSDDTMILWWRPTKMQEWYTTYVSGTKQLNLSRLFDADSRDMAFVQFVMVDSASVRSLRQQFPHVANLGGIYDPKLPHVKEIDFDEDRVTSTTSNSSLATTRRPVRKGAKPLTDVNVSPQRFDIGSSDGDARSASSSRQADLSGQQEGDVIQSDEGDGLGASPPHTTPPISVSHSVACAVGILQDDEPAELVFTARTAKYVAGERRKLREDEELVCMYEHGKPGMVIERVNNIMTHEEALKNADGCKASMLQELGRWAKHKAWRRMPRKQDSNLLQSRWVLKWKDIADSSGQKQRNIKARLVVQGFRDRQAVERYSGTTTRWGQRMVLIVAKQRSWHLVSADVSEAFLRGLSFRELEEMDPSKPLREVPPGSGELLRCLSGMEDFNESVECLQMLKPGFGLRDAPKLWNLALWKVLLQQGLTSSHADPQLYIRQRDGRLCLLVSVHVDDLRITGETAVINALIKALESHFDALKLEWDNFEHLGLKHCLHEDGSRSVSQQHYVSELRSIPDDDLRHNPSVLVAADVACMFMSLLGGVAWVTQTRPDISVFIAALQRKIKQPCGADVIKLNRVLHYVQKKPLVMRCHKIPQPWRLIAVSDSSYKGDEQDCLAMRSGLILLASKDGLQQGVNRIQVLEFVSKKQSRVCRSTYAAELFSALDLVGLGVTIHLALTQVLLGNMTAAKLAELQEKGKLALQMDCVIDARAVQDSVVAEEVKTPNDKIMLIHALRMRELLDKGQISNLIWCDTRDMIADGLNKGVIKRDALHEVCSDGIWRVNHPLKICSTKRQAWAEQSS